MPLGLKGASAEPALEKDINKGFTFLSVGC